MEFLSSLSKVLGSISIATKMKVNILIRDKER